MLKKDKRGPTVCINIPPGARLNPLAAVHVRPLPGPDVKHLPTKSLHLSPHPPSYKELLQILYDATFITDPQGIVLDLNARAVDFFLYDPSEIRNTQLLNLISGADDSLLKAIRQNLENQRFTYIEAYSLRKDGTAFPSEIVVNKLLVGTSANLCFFIRDTSRRKRVEEELRQSNESLLELNHKLRENQMQLVQSEKMAALGQIAAGVAHEINNPVGFVRSNLNTFSEYVVCFKKLLDGYHSLATAIENGDEAEQKKILNEVQEIEKKENLEAILRDVGGLLKESVEGLERTKEIVRDLKTFARLDESERKEANVNDGIETTLKIIGNEMKYHCQLHKKLGEIPSISCYPGQLNQVILNLLLNASQAISDHGNITIETEATPTHIIIRVSDDGKGISEEHLPKIFTPFFTTKPPGKGTGLGLSISYGIIQKHNGTIDVKSEEGKGTIFTIQLPIET
jgi:PAS domain S-box-containing protein